MNFSAVYAKMFTHIFNPILGRFNVPESRRAYVIKFYLTGIYAVVTEWLNKDCSDDMSEIVKIIIDCVLGERGVNGQNV